MHTCVQLIHIAFSRKKGNVHECPINLHTLFDVSRERSSNFQLIYMTFSTYVLCVVECPINLHSFLAFRMGGPAKKQACEGGHVQLMYQNFMVWINWTRR